MVNYLSPSWSLYDMNKIDFDKIKHVLDGRDKKTKLMVTGNGLKVASFWNRNTFKHEDMACLTDRQQLEVARFELYGVKREFLIVGDKEIVMTYLRDHIEHLSPSLENSVGKIKKYLYSWYSTFLVSKEAKKQFKDEQDAHFIRLINRNTFDEGSAFLGSKSIPFVMNTKLLTKNETKVLKDLHVSLSHLLGEKYSIDEKDIDGFLLWQLKCSGVQTDFEKLFAKRLLDAVNNRIANPSHDDEVLEALMNKVAYI